MAGAPHVPVLLAPLLRAVAPVSGTWIDGTLGAGGYTRGLLEAGAAHVIGIDRDPSALTLARERLGSLADRVTFHKGNFAQMDEVATGVDGVVLVVRGGMTDRAALELTLERLNRIGAHVAGIVLNDSELPSSYRTYSHVG